MFLYTAEYNSSQDAIKGQPDRQPKEAAMMFRVHAIDTFNSC